MAVEVEVDVSPRALPKTILVGLPEAAVRESTYRVERAIVNSGFVRPQDRCSQCGDRLFWLLIPSAPLDEEQVVQYVESVSRVVA